MFILCTVIVYVSLIIVISNLTFLKGRELKCFEGKKDFTSYKEIVSDIWPTALDIESFNYQKRVYHNHFYNSGDSKSGSVLNKLFNFVSSEDQVNYYWVYQLVKVLARKRLKITDGIMKGELVDTVLDFVASLEIGKRIDRYKKNPDQDIYLSDLLSCKVNIMHNKLFTKNTRSVQSSRWLECSGRTGLYMYVEWGSLQYKEGGYFRPNVAITFIADMWDDLFNDHNFDLAKFSNEFQANMPFMLDYRRNHIVHTPRENIRGSSPSIKKSWSLLTPCAGCRMLENTKERRESCIVELIRTD